MSISMNSVLTQFNESDSSFWDWQKYYIDKEHTIVSYMPGTGGEWLCGFLASHAALSHQNTDMNPQRVSNHNRWRIKGSNISHMSNKYRDEYWNEEETWDGSEAWFKTAVGRAIEWGTEQNFRRNLVLNQTNQTITRSHEAWQEIAVWPQQYRRFRVITLINDPDAGTWDQLCSNIAKKIWLHEYENDEDMWDEFENKWSKAVKQHPEILGREREIREFMEYLGAPYTWVKIQYAIKMAINHLDHDRTMDSLRGHWDDGVGEQKLNDYRLPLPVEEYKLDLLALLQTQDYDGKYLEMCEFMGIDRHSKHDFETLCDFYFGDDAKNIITSAHLKERLEAVSDHARLYKRQTTRALL